MIIGLTGGIGSGKSTAAKVFKAAGYKVVDADHECMVATKKGSEALRQLTEEFGSGILCSDGRLNRKKLAALCFGSKQKTAKLSRIVQTQALKSCMQKMERYQSRGFDVIFDVPLLFEAGWNKYCDKTVTVSCSEDIRIARVTKRDTMTEEAVRARLKNQYTDAQREAEADFCIKNEKGIKDLEKAVASVIKKLQK